MLGTKSKAQSRRSQVVSFSYNRNTHDTATGPNSAPEPTPQDRDMIMLPLAFQGSAVPAPQSQPRTKPHLVPVETQKNNSRKVPLIVRGNRAFQTILVALCGAAICSYGLDVVVSHDVSKLQQQARRLSEQNSELSAKLLKAISYGELQDSVVGRFGLRVPDQVLILKEITPPQVQSFKAHRHELPLMSGY
ncbi:MAG: hypothetical protein K8F91_00100 [Candidatus Obscuribacterales bacterium]|nr:hypothetical protein [Candidatus Obscuribacterales bacterium]